MKVHLCLRISSICPSDTICFGNLWDFVLIRSNLKSRILQSGKGNAKPLEAKVKT